MRSRAKIFTRNGSKGQLKAVMQKYFQEMAGKRCFEDVVQKYSCPGTHRDRIPDKEYYFKCRNIILKKYYFKIFTPEQNKEGSDTCLC